MNLILGIVSFHFSKFRKVRDTGKLDQPSDIMEQAAHKETFRDRIFFRGELSASTTPHVFIILRCFVVSFTPFVRKKYLRTGPCSVKGT